MRRLHCLPNTASLSHPGAVKPLTRPCRLLRSYNKFTKTKTWLQIINTWSQTNYTNIVLGCSQQANTTDYRACLTVAGVLPHSSSCKWMKLRKQMDLCCDRVQCVSVLLHCVALTVSPAAVRVPFILITWDPRRPWWSVWGGGMDRSTLTTAVIT